MIDNIEKVPAWIFLETFFINVHYSSLCFLTVGFNVNNCYGCLCFCKCQSCRSFQNILGSPSCNTPPTCLYIDFTWSKNRKSATRMLIHSYLHRRLDTGTQLQLIVRGLLSDITYIEIGLAHQNIRVELEKTGYCLLLRDFDVGRLFHASLSSKWYILKLNSILGTLISLWLSCWSFYYYFIIL